MSEDKHKVQPYSVRLPSELRARLEAAAAVAGRTLHQEVIFRLGNSFEVEGDLERFGGKFAARVVDEKAGVTVGDLSTKELFDQMAAPDGVLDRLAEKLRGYIRVGSDGNSPPEKSSRRGSKGSGSSKEKS